MDDTGDTEDINESRRESPGPLDAELMDWFAAEGLVRTRILADERGEVVETVVPPLVALGPRDDDFVLPPRPERAGYSEKSLAEMSLQDYNAFIFHWLEAAVRAGEVRCANCGKRLRDAPDLPASDTWDAIFIEKELVGWMLVHFDCKRWLAKKLKGMHPFELAPRATPQYNLAGAPPDDAKETANAADAADTTEPAGDSTDAE